MASSSKKKTDLLPLAAIVVVLILGILWVYPKLVQKIQTSPAPSTESTNSNSDETYASANPSSLEAIEAKNEFFFTLTSPTKGMTVTSSGIKVTGKTVPGADVFVNEIDAKADAQGNFSINYTLEEGENYLIIGANDVYGNFEEKEVQITLQSAEQ